MKPILRILIVQHHDRQRKQLASILRLKGFDVLPASSGFQALSLYEREDINVVIVVNHLMDMPSSEVISLVNIQDKFLLGTIYLTSENDTEINQMVLEAGATITLAHNPEKPNFNKLIKVLLALQGSFLKKKKTAS